jgi:hypothetical protein
MTIDRKIRSIIYNNFFILTSMGFNIEALHPVILTCDKIKIHTLEYFQLHSLPQDLIQGSNPP